MRTQYLIFRYCVENLLAPPAVLSFPAVNGEACHTISVNVIAQTIAQTILTSWLLVTIPPMINLTSKMMT
jgi:hypothetical protein